MVGTNKLKLGSAKVAFNIQLKGSGGGGVKHPKSPGTTCQYITLGLGSSHPPDSGLLVQHV